jgi:hypothetical protein
LRLIARKLALLFGFNRGVPLFYAACRFDELSRESVSCLFNTSFEKRFHNATTQFFTPKLMTWRPPRQYGANIHPMAVSSGISGSPRPAVLGNALGTAPPDLHGRQNGLQSRSIFSFFDFI